MRETGHELNDVGRTLSWDALDSFLRNIKPDSSTACSMDPDLSIWATSAKTNALLADIYDLLAIINADLVALGTGKRAKRPKRYPRPGQKEKTIRHLGNKESAMPVNKMREWLEERRRNDPRNKR